MVQEYIGHAYPKARRAAALETGLARDAFPEGCPFAETDVLAVDYLPESD